MAMITLLNLVVGLRSLYLLVVMPLVGFCHCLSLWLLKHELLILIVVLVQLAVVMLLLSVVVVITMNIITIVIDVMIQSLFVESILLIDHNIGGIVGIAK